MKKKLLYLTLIFTPFISKAQTAFEFLEKLNNEFRQLQHLQIDYISNMVHQSGVDLEIKKLELQTAASSAIQNISSLPLPPNDKGLQKSALETFKGMSEMTKKNYKEIILKKAGCNDCFAADELEYKEMKNASDEVSKSFGNMQKRIVEFANDNNIKLVDTKDEFDLIIAKVNRINDYIQLLNLCAAQPQYASDEVIRLFNEQKIDEASAAIKFLKKEVKNAQKRLKTVSAIKEDAICIKKVEILLSFYQNMADEVYSQMLSSFDKKGEIKQSALNSYNNNIDKINLQLSQKISDFEQAKTSLLQRNIPKPVKEKKS